jgi:hypothetical protein
MRAPPFLAIFLRPKCLNAPIDGTLDQGFDQSIKRPLDSIRREPSRLLSHRVKTNFKPPRGPAEGGLRGGFPGPALSLCITHKLPRVADNRRLALRWLAEARAPGSPYRQKSLNGAALNCV